MLSYVEFLDEVIQRGIEAAKADYTGPKQARRLKGSLEGFEACRGLTPPQLLELLGRARASTHEEMLQDEDIDKYQELRCFEAEVEWVCNFASAWSWLRQGEPLIVPPTARAAVSAAEIVVQSRTEDDPPSTA